MSVAEETNIGVLISETGGGREAVKHITPALRSVQGGMNDRKAGNQPEYFSSRSHFRSSGLNCFRVQLTASAAYGLNPSMFPSLEQYSSWFPLMHGMPISRMISRHSLGLALYPTTSPKHA